METKLVTVSRVSILISTFFALTTRRKTTLRSTTKYKPNVKCRVCNQQGHMEKACKVYKTKAKSKVVVAKKVIESEELFFMAKLDDKWAVKDS